MYDYSDYYDYYDYSSTPAFNPLPTIISLVLCVFVLVCMWIIFRKAGKPGWAAIVPFYNLYVLFDITWGSGMRFLLMLIPLYNIILGIQTQIRLAKAFGKGGGFAAGLIFLPYVFMPLLAFGKGTYQGVPIKAAPYQNNPYQNNPYQQGGYSQQPHQPYQNPYSQQPQYNAPQQGYQQPQQPQYAAAPPAAAVCCAAAAPAVYSAPAATAACGTPAATAACPSAAYPPAAGGGDPRFHFLPQLRSEEQR